jgi:stage II sporulation protein AA (anti-sigma F factor antagonist)
MKDRPTGRAAQTWTLSVTPQLVDGKAELLVSGRLGNHGASQLEAACLTAMEQGCRTLVIDLAGVDYLSSPGLRLFEKLKTDLAAQGGSLTVTNPTDPVRLALDLAGMLELMEAQSRGPLGGVG